MVLPGLWGDKSCGHGFLVAAPGAEQASLTAKNQQKGPGCGGAFLMPGVDRRDRLSMIETHAARPAQDDPFPADMLVLEDEIIRVDQMDRRLGAGVHERCLWKWA
jgi:hypothetical protein